MWKCPKCETINNNEYCIVCGEKQPPQEQTVQTPKQDTQIPQQSAQEPFEPLESIPEMYTESQQKPKGRGLLIACISIIAVSVIAITVGVTILITGSIGGEQDRARVTPSATPTQTASPSPAANLHKLYENREAFAKTVRQQLNIPEYAQITYQVSDAYFWEAGNMEVASVSFYENGVLVASADCDTTTGSLVRSILNYMPPVTPTPTPVATPEPESVTVGSTSVDDIEHYISSYVRKRYDAINDSLGMYTKTEKNGVTCWHDGKGCAKKTYSNGLDGYSMSREYYYDTDNGNMIFAFLYDGTTEYRLYFNGTQLVRYIDPEKKEYNNPTMEKALELARLALSEAYES